MEPNQGQPLAAEEVAALKEEIAGLVDEAAAEGTLSRDQIIDAVVAGLDALKGDSGPAMGGLGGEEGMSLPDDVEEED